MTVSRMEAFGGNDGDAGMGDRERKCMLLLQVGGRRGGWDELMLG